MINKIGISVSLKRIIAAIIIAFVLIASTVALLPINTIAEGIIQGTVFTNSATADTDIGTFIQQNLNNMNTSIIYTVSGIEICKLFLETDSNGEIMTDFVYKDYVQHVFEKQINNMSSASPPNYNGYYNLGYDSWQINTVINYSTYTTTGKISSISITVTYTVAWNDGTEYPDALNGRNAVINHAKAFLSSSQYPKNGSYDQRLRAINEYICQTFQYDYRLFETEPTKSETIYSAYKMISDTGALGGYPRGVCQAYAMYGYIMLKEAGFEAITIRGNANNGPHAWNMVKVGNDWYHIDFTWNDPIDGSLNRQSGAGIVSYNYFMRSDNEMKINHTWNSRNDGGFIYPLANKQWTGNDPIADITQPNPEPTVTINPTPTIVVIPVATPTTVTSSSSSDGTSSSGSDLSQYSDSLSSLDTSSISADSNVSVNASIAISQDNTSGELLLKILKDYKGYILIATLVLIFMIIIAASIRRR